MTTKLRCITITITKTSQTLYSFESLDKQPLIRLSLSTDQLTLKPAWR